MPAARSTALVVYAFTGNRKRLDALVSKYRADSAGDPPDLVDREVSFVQGIAETLEGRPAKALDLLNPTRYTGALTWMALPYWRGYALLAAKRPAEAVAEFERLLALRHQSPTNVGWQLTHLGLARAQAAAGQLAAGERTYRKFLDLMKDADPGLPIVADARLELAKLGK